MSAIDHANEEQRAASNPRVSAFVAASAGSGKTKLLTDRLLRLMLSGADPAKILCLTYTKAAAAEMQIRLNARLGKWVVMPEPDLAAELRALDVVLSPRNVQSARKLFADVLDLPGGMRIETIHAFCQSLLRRFPLEAQLSPHFEVAEAAEQSARLREARERVLAMAAHGEAIAAVAAELDEPRFAELTGEFAKAQNAVWREASVQRIAAMQRGALGAPDQTYEILGLAAVVWPREGDVARAWQRVHEAGNPSGQECARVNLEWLGLSPDSRWQNWGAWVSGHFTRKDEPKARKGYWGKALAVEAAALDAQIAQECARIEAWQEKLRATKLADLNAHLAVLGQNIVLGEQAEKQNAARLSYGDLITQTAKLLEDPGAAWILYKLDGGIEHLLLDEVQDTAPAQWDIAGAIADEFFAGEGAREGKRTIFAVGDAKQSIFSFQGADLRSFEENRAKFRAKVVAAGQTFHDGKLSVSFRSTAPVLALVDAVFAEGEAQDGVCAPGEGLRHEVSRVGQAGAVSLWPLTRAAEVPALRDWAAPTKYQSAESARELLARQIADHIKTRLEARQFLPSRGRAVTPGDFLILMRRRDALVRAITSQLKTSGVPVAGADRMVLTAQPAVSDLLALCDALLLPEDDLAFGQFLASPLGGLSDEGLMDLALERRGRLYETLYARASERADWAQAKEFFETLRTRVDFLTPFALLSLALGPLGGRVALLRRLGAEAAEPIDELCAEALKFSQTEPGALQLFVHGLRQSGAEIKREAESAGDVVRIMTVHGAKGLQAPIVILPDTVGLPKPGGSLFWLAPPQQPDMLVPVFCPRSGLRSRAVAEAAAAQKAAQMQEHHRLLYVALTRAEDELIICGAEGKAKLPEASWYAAVAAGFTRLPGVVEVDRIKRLECPQSALPDRKSTRAAATQAMLPSWSGAAPGWVVRPASAETTRPERLAPSRGVEDEAKRAIAASPLGEGLALLRGARAAAMAKGRAVHALLQHLPDVQDRRAAARRFIAGQAELADQADDILARVMAVLELPDLAPLFGPGSRAEVPLAGVVGDVEIGGLVDRLVVTGTEVIIADYKTDRAPPADAAGIPDKYLGQLAAYRAILAQIYPGLPVRCLLIWTESAQVMLVPPALLDHHAPLERATKHGHVAGNL